MASNIKNTIVGSFFWKFLEMCTANIAQFVIGIVLARLLFPEDYAILIIALVFINLSKVFVDSGLSTALIQKKEISDADTSSVFYISFLIAAVLYLLLFLCSPIIADFYATPLLSPILQVLGLTLFIGVYSSIQRVFVSRKFLFKVQFIVSLTAALFSGGVGIGMAYMGFSVWALVVQQLISAVLTAVILGIFVRWMPKLTFSWVSAKGLFSYGWKILVASLIEKGHESIRDLSIGTIYTKADLAYYNKGSEYPTTLGSAIDGTVSAVLFPAYSKYQDDEVMLKAMMKRSLTSSAFITFPAMFGLAAVANSFVLLLLTDKWLLCVPFLQIFCCSFALQPISSACLAVIKATGKMGSYLKIQIIKSLFSLAALLCAIPLGVIAIAIGALLSRVFSIYVNSYPLRRFIGYSQVEMVKDLLPCFALSGVMFAAVFSIQFIGLPVFVTLCLQIVVGVVVYFGLAKLFRMDALDFVLTSVKEFVGKKK